LGKPERNSVPKAKAKSPTPIHRATAGLAPATEPRHPAAKAEIEINTMAKTNRKSGAPAKIAIA
jgi:hypothetical protein